MATFKMNCPHCEKRFEAEQEWIGQTFPCPTCKCNFIVSEFLASQKKADEVINPDRNKYNMLLNDTLINDQSEIISALNDVSQAEGSVILEEKDKSDNFIHVSRNNNQYYLSYHENGMFYSAISENITFKKVCETFLSYYNKDSTWKRCTTWKRRTNQMAVPGSGSNPLLFLRKSWPTNLGLQAWKKSTALSTLTNKATHQQVLLYNNTKKRSALLKQCDYRKIAKQLALQKQCDYGKIANYPKKNIPTEMDQWWFNFVCFIIAIIAIIFIIIFLKSCNSQSQSQSKSEEEYPTSWKTKNDPKDWRAEEEKLENQTGLKNAPYSCSRCGMKSYNPIPGGVCDYCKSYLRSKGQ